MARPRRQADELFFDQFTSMPIAEQKIALRMMTELHRYACKMGGAKAQEPSEESNGEQETA